MLYWTFSDNMIPFPGPLDAEQVESMIRAWLAEAPYGLEPDHDGHNTKGWRVYNEAWGHVNTEWQAFVAIEPVWLMHGK